MTFPTIIYSAVLSSLLAVSTFSPATTSTSTQKNTYIESVAQNPTLIISTIDKNENPLSGELVSVSVNKVFLGDFSTDSTGTIIIHDIDDGLIEISHAESETMSSSVDLHMETINFVVVVNQ